METSSNLTSINLETNLINEAMAISGIATPQAVIYMAKPIHLLMEIKMMGIIKK